MIRGKIRQTWYLPAFHFWWWGILRILDGEVRGCLSEKVIWSEQRLRGWTMQIFGENTTVDLQKHRFELQASLIRIFFNSGYCNTTGSEVDWIQGCRTADTEEPWIWRAECECSSVQSLNHVRLFAHQASLSITNSQSLLKLMSIESVMPSNHLILCRPLLLLPSVFPSIRVTHGFSTMEGWHPNPCVVQGQLYRQRGRKCQGPEQRGDLGSKE